MAGAEEVEPDVCLGAKIRKHTIKYTLFQL